MILRAVSEMGMKIQAAGSIQRRLESFRIYLREGGLRGLLGALRPFLFCRQRIEMFALDISKGYSAPRLDPRAEIRKGTLADLDRFRRTAEGRQSEFYRDQIDGAEPYVVYWDGKPAHVAWVYDSTLPTRFARLKPGEAQLGYAYTLEAFRGRGLYGATIAVMAADLARRGYQRLYGHVIVDSAAFSVGLEWALSRVGFRKINTLQHLRILGVQVRPYLSF